MPDLLGVTNPVPGHDNTNINRNMPVSPGDTRVQNAPDPSRVSRPDNRTERQDSGDAAGPGGALRYDSNFQAFMQKLMDTPELSQTLAKVLQDYQAVVSSGLQEGISTEMGALVEMLKMDESQLLKFLTQQLSDGARFSGPLFTILREAYSQSRSESIRYDILQFLKRYGDFTSASHIEGNLMRVLTRLTHAIPSSYGNQLLALTQQLGQSFASGDRAGAMKLLLGTILPFLGSYTEKTHDMGLSRSLISQLALDITRYENGSQANLLQSFHQLLGHTALRARLGNLSDNALLEFINNTAFARGAENNQFANQLVSAAAWALRGEAGVDAQDAFKQIVSAMLINESVYMPVKHAIIPLDWDGKMMFSEVWVDPDAENNFKRGGAEQDNTIRFLFKLDIQGLGFFDIVLASRRDNVEVLIACPEKAVPFTKTIQGEITRILEHNGLKSNGVMVRKMEKPLAISDVFPKIFEGENSVNVKI